jgi:membrane protein implicated in regulation of membrane protease activity
MSSSKTFLSVLIVVIVLFVGSFFLHFIDTPIRIVIHLVLVTFILILAFKYFKKKKEEKEEKYDYCRENPNALLSGKVYGGAVYTAYPENVPGLGWLL